ncbi:MAG: hypothetical protein PHT02_15045, partial [Tissierellia bacterium]|nr:hypothetical protein [Tissierellia bacterium]
MNKEAFADEIISIYQFIQNEKEIKRIEFIGEGLIKNSRISYEYINLDSIFQKLINVLPYVLDFYNNRRLKHIRKEMYCVFIATLCEISKRGFSQGGILKQIDEYIGGF